MPDVNITTVVTAMAPAFAAGFAVQQGLQILDSLLNLDNKINANVKRGLAGATSLILGLLFAWGGIRVLAPLYPNSPPPLWVDYLVSALVISAGTEGFNSIMKFIGYTKDNANPANTQKRLALTESIDSARADRLQNVG